MVDLPADPAAPAEQPDDTARPDRPAPDAAFANLVTPPAPRLARGVDGRAAHAVRWLREMGLNYSINLCLVRQIAYDRDPATDTWSCTFVMAYSDNGGRPVCYRFTGNEVVQAVMDLEAREQVWLPRARSSDRVP